MSVFASVSIDCDFITGLRQFDTNFGARDLRQLDTGFYSQVYVN